MNQLEISFMMEVNPKLKDPRRMQERKDSREIQEDFNSVANLPEKGFQKIWQKNNVFKYPY